MYYYFPNEKLLSRELSSLIEKNFIYDLNKYIGEGKEYEEIIISPNTYLRLTVPPGIWFGFKGLGKHINLISNIADIEHDPSEVQRKSLSEIEYNWKK